MHIVSFLCENTNDRAHVAATGLPGAHCHRNRQAQHQTRPEVCFLELIAVPLGASMRLGSLGMEPLWRHNPAVLLSVAPPGTQAAATSVLWAAVSRIA